ncbi:MAG TPA: hypothetical protein VI895_08595 [Bdellovibrionota bacterium]|nr:hypothetical protein [Bdellovibrionota bacterium]
MTVSRNTLIHIIKQARLSEILRDLDLEQLMTGTPARRYSLVKRALAKGDLLQIRRGLYTLNDLYRTEKIHPFALAQWICGPSYISFESALSYWELIPEGVRTVTSGTSSRSREFDTPLGHYSFTRVPFSPLYAEVTRIKEGSEVFFMAKPLRAMADYVYGSKKEWTKERLAESLRIDDMPKMDRKAAALMHHLYNNGRVRRFIDSYLE